MDKRQAYPSDLTDEEWHMIARLVPRVKRGGRRAEHPRREIVNAVFYVLRTGCQWPMLPHDFPPWKTVYTYFRNWRKDGSWARIHETLRTKVRRAAGRQPSASAAILDSQTVKTTEKGGRAATTRPRKLPAEKGIF